MKELLFLICVICLFPLSYGSCNMQVFYDSECTSTNGITIPQFGQLIIPEKCEKCSCSLTRSGNSMMHCCGYGIYAGTIAPPAGCKVIAGDDGCSVKMVLSTDASKTCPH